MTNREEAVILLRSFLENKEYMVLVPKTLLRIMYDALEQEAVCTITIQKEVDFRSEIECVSVCGNCRHELVRYPKKWNFCPECGRAVKWDG